MCVCESEQHVRFLIYVGFNVFFFSFLWITLSKQSWRLGTWRNKKSTVGPPRSTTCSTSSTSSTHLHHAAFYAVSTSPPRDWHFLYNLLSGRLLFFPKPFFHRFPFVYCFQDLYLLSRATRERFSIHCWAILILKWASLFIQFGVKRYSHVCVKGKEELKGKRLNANEQSGYNNTAALKPPSGIGGREEEVITTAFFIQVNSS